MRTARPLGLKAGFSSIGIAAMVLTLAAPAQATTETFATPGNFTWTSPANISSARFLLEGGEGGTTGGGVPPPPSGQGGVTRATLPLVSSSAYGLRVAQKGANGLFTGGSGGAPGGGTGATRPGFFGGAGGGGASIVALGDALVSANWLLVAGGGGGDGFGAGDGGGDGGGLTGARGAISFPRCPAGGGAGGNQDGTTGSGMMLNGSAGTHSSGTSGGGGGGYYGGSGDAACGGGGGGGSGFIIPSARDSSFPAANNNGDGSITITYFTLTVTAPADGTVSGPGINCGSGGVDCTERYAPDDPITLTASPASGFTFDGFTGGCSGMTCPLTLSADTTVGAGFTVEVVDPDPPDPGTPDPGTPDPGTPDPTPKPEAPNTTITKAPKKKTTKAKATFAFEASVSGSTFECKLDKGKFAPCTSPAKLKVKKGKHVYSVRAVGPTKLADATPAETSWKFKPKKKKPKK